jgi:hypothetical protein
MKFLPLKVAMLVDKTPLQLPCVHFFFFPQANQIGQTPSMCCQIGELVSYHLCWVKPLDEDGAVGSNATAKFWTGHFIVVRCA